MCKMSAKNHIDRLDSPSETIRFPFGMFLMRLLRSSTIDRRRICPHTGSNSVSRTLSGNGRRRNDIQRCGQLFRRRRFIKEENQTRTNGIHRRAVGGFAEKFRNRQQSRWTRFGEDRIERRPQQTGDASLVSKCSRQTKEAHISRQTQRWAFSTRRGWTAGQRVREPANHTHPKSFKNSFFYYRSDSV